ncbi:aminomethyl-transferring glycine dehydrogenase [Bdellovibrionota bacterium FG-1]
MKANPIDLVPASLEFTDSFVDRHLGPDQKQREEMLRLLGFSSLDQMAQNAVPKQIQTRKPLALEQPLSEFEAINELKLLASRNQIFKSYIGMGYSDCITPPVIQRNVLENPGWYTQYTPYQAEIAQGRLEALLNFQTMVMDMTGMEIANASMLDEGTAAAEAMNLCYAVKGRDHGRHAFFVSSACHPQTIAVVQTRARPLGIEVVVGDHRQLDFKTPIFGALVQYPATDGVVYDYREFSQKAHAAEVMVVAACDLLSLSLLTPPGEWGADIAVGNSQRLGVPLGFGGPHAAFFATQDAFKRQMPGRLIGVSKDVDGRPAIRLALQTREQHIRRDKATSNICTAQVLLAIMSSMYAIYHGPQGLRRIANRIHLMTTVFQRGLSHLGFKVGTDPFFDTLRVELGSISLKALLAAAQAKKINLRTISERVVGVSLDETTSYRDLLELWDVFAQVAGKVIDFSPQKFAEAGANVLPTWLVRHSQYLTHPVFNLHHSETEMLRYISQLQNKDLSLTHSMTPLGSCTMKLNATTEMLPVTWPEFSRIHPFAPEEQWQGYRVMLTRLEGMLGEVTGFAGVSLQPNAGSQGEYTGLLVIRAYHESRGQKNRDVCLIPRSAHGTNPASAAMAGLKVVVVACDPHGNIDVADLKAKAKEHATHLAALLVTYPSTHGVFEESIKEVCEIVHANGGQVYMDGANMNAQIGLCRPGEFGPDVCHLNLHKTFCIPHGGGGPGVGPIGVASHLVPFLPGHPVVKTGGAQAIGPVSAAPWGSASILAISYLYVVMMGGKGLTMATQVAILNANYIAKRLAPHYPVLYKGAAGLVAHECIFDFHHIKDQTGIEVDDVAKRLMDYGFHAPTISFPVAGTIMVEPTESESKAELDRFCDAMISIRKEIADVESGKADRQNNVLKNAPHTAEQVTRTEWTRPYPREQAAFPLAWVRQHKFWPAVGRINNVLGDRQLVCACPPIEAYL